MPDRGAGHPLYTVQGVPLPVLFGCGLTGNVNGRPAFSWPLAGRSWVAVRKSMSDCTK